MKLGLVGYLIIAVVLLSASTILCGYKWATASSRCQATMAAETGKANEKQAKAEEKRDTALDKVATETKADTKKEVDKVKDKTEARAVIIERVVTTGACKAPQGLPPLDGAVDAANDAAGT
jgi:hypothetical protein